MADLVSDAVGPDYLVDRSSPRYHRRARRRRCGDLTFLEALEPRLLLAAEPFGLTTPVFESNHGQVEASALYVARGADIELSLLRDAAVIGFDSSNLALANSGWGTGQPETADSPPLRITWLGGNESPNVIGVGEFPAVVNYNFGYVASEWAPSSFERVWYDQVYDGIDLEFYGRDGHVEFDWIVAPGIDPSQITMLYAGADNLWLNADGDLVLSAGGQQVVQHAPVVYQVVAGEQREVVSSYRLDAGGAVRFSLGQYDPGLTLVIDPVLSYSTYLGGEPQRLHR